MFARLLIALVFFASLAKAAPDSERLAERYQQMLEKNPVDGTALDRLWKIYQEKSETGKLIEQYKAVSDHFAGAMIFGHLLRKAGRGEEARDAYLGASVLDEKNTLPHLALAQLFSEQTNWKSAAAEYEKALALLPSDDANFSDILLKLGDAWFAANDVAKASDAWERTVARDPGNLALRQRLAENYEGNRLPEKAIAHLEYLEAHGDAAQRAPALQKLARIYQAKGDVDGAIHALERAIALTAPGHWMRGELQSQLIRLHQRYHRTPELEQRWKSNVEKNPRDLAAYLQLADLYERLAKPDEQRIWLEKVCELAPKNPEYKIKLARVLVPLNQLDRAAELFDQVLKEQPGNSDLIFARAEIDVQRDLIPAAKSRVEVMLAKGDDTLTGKALEFYTKHRMFDMVEQHLKGAGRDETDILALANFYFSQRKKEEAVRALQSLVKKDDPPAKQAAAYSQIANVLKEQNDSDGALEATQHAVELQPKSPEYHLALADAFTAANHFDDAENEVAQAFKLSADEAARLAADQRHFQILQSRANENPSSKTSLLDAKGRIDLLSIPLARGTRPQNTALENYIAALAQEADAHPSAEANLRVARWHSWNRNNKAALDFAKRAADLDTSSVAAREMIVKIAVADGQRPRAIDQLRELLKIAPEKKAQYARQIGQLEIESAHLDRALQIFGELEKANPGDAETLTDLAYAQQVAERWPDALATWQRAYEASPPTKKHEIMPSLLRVLERLNFHQKAAELLLKNADEQSDEATRFNVLQDLIAYCARHDLSAWLVAQFEQRHQRQPDDYFNTVALARVLKTAGYARDAFELLSDAVYATPKEAQTLQELVKEAEEFGDFDAAIRHQQQLVSLFPQNNDAALEKLATLQEASLDLDGASATWETVARNFPRDPNALGHAAEFFEKWDSPIRARAILRKIRTLDPANLDALISLAGLAKDAGDQAEALSCFEQILQNSTSENIGDVVKIPDLKTADAGRLQQAYLSTLRARNGRPSADAMRALRTFWIEEKSTPASEREFRLTAIREISRSKKGDALRPWLARFENAESPTETLWAFYFSGAREATMKQLAAMMQSKPDDPQLRQAFIWIALKMGEARKLGEWLDDKRRTPSERDIFLVVLDQFLTQSAADSQLASSLFPERFQYRYILWQAAVVFASHNQFPAAIQLGQRVFDASPDQRAGYGIELARWGIYLGEPARARAVLRKVIAERSDSFDRPVYEALREYWTLLAENERTPFVEAYRESLDRAREPLHSAISLTLLYGLQGDEKSAGEELTRLLNLRALVIRNIDEVGNSAAYRYWTFLLTAGMQLQAWKLDSLAMALWEKSLADPASIRLQGDQATEIAREVRLRLFAAKLTRADAVEAETLLDEYVRSSPSESVQALASVLENNGFVPAAIDVYARLRKRDPKNEQYLRNLLNACRAGNDFETATNELAEAVNNGLRGANPAVFRESIAQLSDFLTRKNRWAEAQRVIAQGLASAPNEPQFLERLARAHEQQRHWDKAEAIWRKLLSIDPGNDARRIALAATLDVAGKSGEAIGVLESAKNARDAGVQARLAELYFKAGQLDKAQLMAEQLLREGSLNSAAEIATRLAEKGENKTALRLFQNAVGRSKDANTTFQLQQKLIEALVPPGDAKLMEKEMKQLRMVADGAPELLAAYFDFLDRIAKKFHFDPEPRLVAEWRDGAGPLAAGAALLARFVETKQEEKLRAAFPAFLATHDFDPQIFAALNERLKQAKRHDLAVQISEILCRQNPLSENDSLDYARSLNALGRSKEAARALETLEHRQLFPGDLSGRIAQAYLDFKNVPAARRAFEIAVKNDPAARQYDVHLSYARLLLDDHDLRGAKRILQLAFRNPANHEADQIVEFYAAAKRLDRAESEVAEFHLRAEALRAFYAALFSRYEKAEQFADALAVVAKHPEVVADNPALRERLRAVAAKSVNFSGVTSLVETAIAQSHDPDTALDLALIYNDWAADELARFDSATALEKLKRANELSPAHFEIAQRLCNLYLEKKEKQRAALVLTTLIETTNNPADREKARQILQSYNVTGAR